MVQILLSIDIGTTAIKAGAFTPNGQLIVMSYIEYPLLKPNRWWVEQDSTLWLNLSWEAIKRVLNSPKLDSRKVLALSVSAQGISFVPLDHAGRPLSNAFSWLDTRAKRETQIIKDYCPSISQAFQKYGIHINETYTLPKLIWLKANRPQLFKQAYMFSTCLDFINKQLVGSYVTDHSIAGGTLMHNLNSLSWDRELLIHFQIPEEKLPEIKWGGAPLGNIQKEIASKLNIPYDVKIVLGGHDQECAALGAGLGVQDITVSLGTASIIIAMTETPVFDHKMRIPCYPHVEKNEFVLEAVVSAAGISFQWLRDLFSEICIQAGGKQFTYMLMDELAAKSREGAGGVFFYPHLSGATSPNWDPKATGSFIGLSLASNLMDIIRAVLEGWCFQIKSNLIAIEEITNPRNRVIFFGGGVQSRFLRQLLCNILNRPLLIPVTSETALLGAAMLAGLGAGLYTDLQEIKSIVQKGSQIIEPEQKISKSYEDIYAQYIEIEKHIVSSQY